MVFEIALFTEAQPTPLISWAVKDLEAAGGVMITASHNPANFNGFKIKAPWGGSAAPETTREVEKLVDATPPKRATVSDDGHRTARARDCDVIASRSRRTSISTG